MLWACSICSVLNAFLPSLEAINDCVIPDNEVLFDYMKELDIYNLIQTMTETDPEEFKKLLTEINNFEYIQE